jgi:hypothetical protein
MEEEKLKELLNALAEHTTEPARPGLAEDIKHQIPSRLVPDSGGMGTMNIIIDLRINRLAAAAIIVITMILLAGVFGRQHFQGDNIFQDSKMLVGYILGTNAHRSDLSALRARCEHLMEKGEEVVYYGDKADLGNGNAVLLHWKTSAGKYKVVFGDLSERTLSACALIRLQAYMLQEKKTK